MEKFFFYFSKFYSILLPVKKIKHLFTRSLKPIETEEPIALLVFRPISFILAVMLKPTPIHPNIVTIVSMVCGVITGYFFFNLHIYPAYYAALALFITHTLDCVDGQLARIKGLSSRLGKTLDGIADIITYIAIFGGVAYAISHNGLKGELHWTVYALFALFNYQIHIHMFDHFKNELIHYSIPEYHEKLESIDRLKRIYRNLGHSLAARGYKVVLFFYIGFYIIERAVIRLAQPNDYQGYLEWYYQNNNIPASVKKHFRTHYRHYNWCLVRGWSMLGATTHVSVFLVCTLLNRLDLIFWIICVPFNIWTLFLVICQRLIIRIQLNKAFKAGRIS